MDAEDNKGREFTVLGVFLSVLTWNQAPSEWSLCFLEILALPVGHLWFFFFVIVVGVFFLGFNPFSSCI